ncbi:MAG TPA: hypothetical protein VM143_13780 [Acidimicrobiales bacterium]|nr:hypothetical protein [Acidimicrobiales bacterium]
MNLSYRSRVGLVIAAVYVVTAAATIQLTSHHVRPLFEGFTPPPPYQWVNPPAEFRAGNQKPSATDGTVGLGPDGSAQASVNTDDGQVSLNFPQNAFPAHSADTAIGLHITPLDPATLGPTPSGLAADGNAYRVEATFQPSKQPVDKLSAPANIFLVVPEPATSLLFSPDGNVWQQLDAQQTGGSAAIAAAFDRPGFFLGATPPTAAPADKMSDTARIVLIAGLTVALALVLLFGPAAWRRLRTYPIPARPGRRRPTGTGKRDRPRR